VLIVFLTPVQCEILHTNSMNYNISMLCLPDSVPYRVGIAWKYDVIHKTGST